MSQRQHECGSHAGLLQARIKHSFGGSFLSIAVMWTMVQLTSVPLQGTMDVVTNST